MTNNDIKTFYEQRGIKRVCHFTSLTNLAGIFQYQFIYSTDELESRNYPFVKNDLKRRDNNIAGISCSITVPNKRLLWRWMKESEDDWVILAIAPTILRRYCTFFPSNASKDNGAHGMEGISGLQKMFFTSGRHHGLDDSRPTDIQAEIMVKDRIPLRLINGIFVENESVKHTVNYLCKELLPESSELRKLEKILVNDRMFRECDDDLNYWGTWNG